MALRQTKKILFLGAVLFGIAGLSFATSSVAKDNMSKKEKAPTAQLSGTVKLDGSSTVFPISEAVAEEFQKEHRKVRVTVGLSGTGGGFKKFAQGEVDVTGASRPIKKIEREATAKNNIKYIELPVAYDGIAVVVNPSNKFVTTLTVAQLKSMWNKDSKVTYWSDVNPNWPKEKISFYSPGADSGTFDYFTKAINGQSRNMRQVGLTASEDDNVLVQGVAGNKYSIGYFGYAYYAENTSRLKVLPIASGAGKAITPSPETINNNTYQPLSRPIFIYVNGKSITKPEVLAFVEFYLGHAKSLVPQVGYVALSDQAYTNASKRVHDTMFGTVFGIDTGKTKRPTLEAMLLQKGEM